MRNQFIALCLLAAGPTLAQETYENANIATEDLNGTARYVGMGGAMEALGADLSTIGTNPAGMGLFRRSTISATGGLVSQQDAPKFDYGDKTNMSFDQIGFVYAHRTGNQSFLNIGFNYHKSRNFNYILSAADQFPSRNADGQEVRASQNKLSYIKGKEGVFNTTAQNGEIVGTSNTFNQVDFLYYNTFLADEDGNYYYNESESYDFNRAQNGYIGEYDFNLSGNVNDRFYWGLTMGIHDVHYKTWSEYNENIIGGGILQLTDQREIEGSGFDLKFGFIFRPVEASPFRIGLYVNTPVWYDLTTNNHTELINNTTYGLYDNGYSNEEYDFKVYTPWKFGLSLGHTVGNWLALGATYEFSDYSSINTRINTGGGYDWYWDAYYESTDPDQDMNDHTDRTLKGVSTLKIGAELKATDALALRLGFGYVSPIYKDTGFKDGSVNSPGTYYASSTDFTNWESTYRLTCGVGYNVGHFNFDLAYQYAQQRGNFMPFMSYYGDANEAANEDDNICNAVKVDNKRHQLLFTIGYRF